MSPRTPSLVFALALACVACGTAGGDGTPDGGTSSQPDAGSDGGTTSGDCVDHAPDPAAMADDTIAWSRGGCWMTSHVAEVDCQSDAMGIDGAHWIPPGRIDETIQIVSSERGTFPAPGDYALDGHSFFAMANSWAEGNASTPEMTWTASSGTLHVASYDAATRVVLGTFTFTSVDDGPRTESGTVTGTLHIRCKQ